MSSWKEVRRVARQRHNEIAQNPDALVRASVLLAAAAESTGIKVVSRPPGDTLLDGAEAAYDRERCRIYYSSGTSQPLAQFHIAHEFAHHWLNEAAASCVAADLDPLVPAEPELSSVGDQDSYSPKERAEAQANLFAREFLLPRSKLLQRCNDGKFDADSIASELGLQIDLVMQQLADALLLPVERNEAVVARVEGEPDDSQKEAIQAPQTRKTESMKRVKATE